MKIILFDESSLKATAGYWIESAVEADLDDELIELNEQFFEYIQTSKSYGNYLDRPSLNTHIGICDDDSDFPNVIVEVGYHRRGREKTIKIMDIYISPKVDSLVKTDYHAKYAEYLIFAVQTFLRETDSSGSATKIYARTDQSQAFLELMHATAKLIQADFEKVGLSVEFEGKRWLAFRRH
ncbi:hypothetical protein [Acinetobacter sp. YH12116]|uniref:hypothetical protein n=1 Tax=Acinetobacter sp. YH12116 TaxID=2601103 RepID=UPI0015D1516D|nr:hypothetical protein [Acinetobacter sp. YH12116]